MTEPQRTGWSASRLWAFLLIALAGWQPVAAQAAPDLWQAAEGQRWFYALRQGGGEQLAGSWWQPLLEPGKRYRMTFNVRRLDGVMGVRLGPDPLIEITRTGAQSIEFDVQAGSPRRMLFTSVRRVGDNPIVASVNNISVFELGSQPPVASTLPPKGHYLSFSRERNLKDEMLDLIDDPGSAQSGWHLQIAMDIADAFRTPGVRGFAVEFPWRSLETADGVFDWRALDDNMTVAERFGLRFVVKVQDRSFDSARVLPTYFPSNQVISTRDGGGQGTVARRWDAYTYERQIRLYRAIGARYGQRAGFGGILTTETAVGQISTGGYTFPQYRNALTQVIERTQPALGNGMLFLALNFLRDGVSRDMNKDGRVALLEATDTGKVAIGGPDITPDANGMPGSLNSYRQHMAQTQPGLRQYCNLQHTDQGRGGRNVRSNQYRDAFQAHVNTVRQREAGPFFSGEPAVFVFDALKNRNGTLVQRHPASDLGALWQPREIFEFAVSNFDCDYMFWHYRENVNNLNTEFWWPDIQPLILERPSFPFF